VGGEREKGVIEITIFLVFSYYEKLKEVTSVSAITD